jgi:ABC-type sugar transport system ATPase subunit
MNLIPCQLATSGEGAYLELVGGHRIPVRDERIAHTLTASGGDRNLVLGVHPEDLLISTEHSPENIPVEVYSFEPLGAETIVDVVLGKDEAGDDIILKSRVGMTFVGNNDRCSLRIGQTLWMTCVPDRIHIFDGDTGEAIC